MTREQLVPVMGREERTPAIKTTAWGRVGTCIQDQYSTSVPICSNGVREDNSRDHPLLDGVYALCRSTVAGQSWFKPREVPPDIG